MVLYMGVAADWIRSSSLMQGEPMHKPSNDQSVFPVLQLRVTNPAQLAMEAKEESHIATIWGYVQHK